MTATGGTQSVNLFVKTRAHVVHLLHTRRQRSAGAWVGMLHPRVQAFHCASFACNAVQQGVVRALTSHQKLATLVLKSDRQAMAALTDVIYELISQQRNIDLDSTSD